MDGMFSDDDLGVFELLTDEACCLLASFLFFVCTHEFSQTHVFERLSLQSFFVHRSHRDESS